MEHEENPRLYIPISSEMAQHCVVGENCEFVVKGKIVGVTSRRQADKKKILDESDVSVDVETVDMVMLGDEEEYSRLADA